MEHTYKIKEKQENPYNTVIEKGNITVDFTLADIKAEQHQLEELITKWRGQINIETEKMKNIEEHHPFVLDMSEQDMFTCHMYQESKAVCKGLQTRLPALEEQLAGSKAEEALIVKKLGLDKEIAVKTAVDAIVTEPTV